MPSREEILDGIAEFNYYYPDGKPMIRIKWEELNTTEKKPYIDVGKLQVFKLHSQGVVIKVDRELPENEFTSPENYEHEPGFYCSNDVYGIAQEEMLKAGYAAVESLIEKEATNGKGI